MILSDTGTYKAIVAEAFGEITPMLGNGYFYQQSSITLASQQAAYDSLYRNQAWVYVVTRKAGIAAARLPVRVWQREAVGKTLALDSGYAKLLAQPNPRMSAFALWKWTAITYELYGEAFWLKIRDDEDNVTALHPMHPTRVTVRRDALTGDIFYLFTLGSRQDSVVPPIPERDVVPFIEYNPANTMRGVSQMEPLRMTLLNEDASRRATASFWQNGARPSVLLKSAKQLSKPAADRLKDQFSARHGGPDNRGGIAVLEEGLDAQIVQLNMEEMQYIQSRQLNREEVCAVADIPPPAVQILDHATFSNITENLRSLYRDTMAPRLANYEAVLDTHLRPDFDPTGELTATFALDEVLRGDFETRASAVVTLVDAGVMMPAEARPMFDLPEAGPNAKKLYAKATVVELGSSLLNSVPPADLDPVALTGLSDPPPAKSLTSVRSIMGALGSVKARGGDPTPTLNAAYQAAIKSALGAAPADWEGALTKALGPWAEATTKTFGTTVDIEALAATLATQLRAVHEEAV